MKNKIIFSDQHKEYYFREACFITELSNGEDDPDVSIARARVEPGVTTQWHSLTGTIERYLIIEGEGIVDIGDRPPTLVTQNDVVVIPSECRQRITNSGEKDLVFLAICSPRFQASNYNEL